MYHDGIKKLDVNSPLDNIKIKKLLNKKKNY